MLLKVQIIKCVVFTATCMLASLGAAQTITINEGDMRSETVTLSDPDTIIINNGEITTGSEVKTINSEGTTSTTVIGSRSHGIFSSGSGAMITNNADGTITTAGSVSHGISSDGFDAVVTNSGAITTTGFQSHGILILAQGIDGTDAVVTNDGAISTTDDSSHGIFSSGSGATITNSGAISTTGDNSHGIFSEGDGAITISGSVSVSGENSFVVKGSDAGDQTLTLGRGAMTNGAFSLGERDNDNDIANIWVADTARSSTYTIGGATSSICLTTKSKTRGYFNCRR